MLCYPTGHEYIRCHRTYRLLAQRLAGTGVAVMRFDYYGGGDSEGDIKDARVRHWLDDIASAIEQLRDRCSPSNICLVGIRMGATLAAMAGSQRDDIDRMVLWNAVSAGRSYIDEVKQMHVAHEQLHALADSADSTDADASDGTEILGYQFSRELIEDLADLDLCRLERRPAPRVLCVENGDAAETPNRRLREHLESLHLTLDHQSLSGPRIWLAEPYEAIVPHQTLQAIMTWINQA